MIKTTPSSPSLFSSLDDLLNQGHPLYKLSHKINWPVFDEAFTPLYCLDNGRPGKPIRLMCGLLILKHLRNTSDESVVEWKNHFKLIPLCQIKLPPVACGNCPLLPGQIDHPEKSIIKVNRLRVGTRSFCLVYSEPKTLVVMSNIPIHMQKLRQIIRLYSLGNGIKTINGMAGISRNTIKKYVKTWHSLDLSFEEFSSKSDAELSALFMAPPSKPGSNKRLDELESVLPEFSQHLRRKGVTRDMLHKEYLQRYPDGYSRSRFNNVLHTYHQLWRPVMHIEHKAGGKLYIDFTGSKLELTRPDGTV